MKWLEVHPKIQWVIIGVIIILALWLIKIRADHSSYGIPKNFFGPTPGGVRYGL